MKNKLKILNNIKKHLFTTRGFPTLLTIKYSEHEPWLSVSIRLFSVNPGWLDYYSDQNVFLHYYPVQACIVHHVLCLLCRCRSREGTAGSWQTSSGSNCRCVDPSQDCSVWWINEIKVTSFLTSLATTRSLFTFLRISAKHPVFVSGQFYPNSWLWLILEEDKSWASQLLSSLIWQSYS